MTELLTFKQALKKTKDARKRHLLLGNGFSIACRSDIFTYGKLFDQADFKGLADSAKAAFKALNTTDFEVVMRALRQAADLAAVYAKRQPDLAERLRQDADGLREVLVQTIAGSHPDRPGSIKEEQYEACRRFLNHFGTFYTLNYDLLLYWALMQDELQPPLSFDDGFRQPEEGPEEYVTWTAYHEGNVPKLYFLHGGLHIFDAGSEIKKYTWKNTQRALIDQIRRALQAGKYPLFVAEGTANEKLERIQHSGFLHKAYRSFAEISGPLFIFGHSLAENDEHILHLIDKGKMNPVVVGLYGDPDEAGNRRIIARAHAIHRSRSPKRPAEILFFDARSAVVWSTQ